MKKHKLESLIYFSYLLFDNYPEITNIISTRLGGASIGHYRSLNLGLHVGDDESSVITNRDTLCEAIGINPGRITSGNQVHGTNIEIITEANQGRGAQSYDDSIPKTDGLVMDVPGIALMVLVADCVVLSFYDPRQKAAGLVHGSWRGTLGRIAQKTITRMEETYGSKAENIVAGISPSIGPCCYEVGENVIHAFRNSFPGYAKILLKSRTKEKAHLDLWEANRMQMIEAGIGEDHIETAAMCTACNTDLFYSYRAEQKKTGRFGGIIVVTG